MELNLVEVKVWCMGCSQQVSAEEAALLNWKYCSHCHHFICPECLSNLGSKPKCLSERCSQESLYMHIEDIPLAKITMFAKSQLTELPSDCLLYKLFYKVDELYAEGPKMNLGSDEAADLFIQTAEETWKNQRLVLTKRSRGRFISWQKIGDV